jgi:hypothetical protein
MGTKLRRTILELHWGATKGGEPKMMIGADGVSQLALSRSPTFSLGVLPVQWTRHERLLQCLLEHRHDPNHTYSEEKRNLTPWTGLVSLAATASEMMWADATKPGEGPQTIRPRMASNLRRGHGLRLRMRQ